MKKKRRNLGTESCISASDESGDKGGNHGLFHVTRNSSRPINCTKIPISRFIPLQHSDPLFLNSPENQSVGSEDIHQK